MLKMIQDTCSGSELNWAALTLAVQSIDKTIQRNHGVPDAVAQGLLATLGKATELTTGRAQPTNWQAMMDSAKIFDGQDLLVLAQERGTRTYRSANPSTSPEIDRTFFR